MQPEPDEANMVSVSAAKRARREDAAARQAVLRDNANMARTATAETVSSAAAAELADLLHVADSNTPAKGPAWAASAHTSHALYYFGGFVVCASCGMMAQRAIAQSKLRQRCQHHLTKERRLGVSRLTRGVLPRSDYSEWPDNGDDVRNGASLRRLAPF